MLILQIVVSLSPLYARVGVLNGGSSADMRDEIVAQHLFSSTLVLL